MDGFLTNPLSALGFGLLAKGQFGPGLLTGLDIYNNQRVAAQQNQLNQLKLQEAQRQEWLRNKQMQAMGRPASLPMTNPVLNNGNMFPGLNFYSDEALKSSRGKPADSVTAMYQAMDPGTGMHSVDPNEQMDALQQYAMYSPNAIASLKALSPKGPKETSDWSNYQRAVSQGYNKKFVDYLREIKPLGAMTIAMPGNSSPTSLKTTEAIVENNPVTRDTFSKLSSDAKQSAVATIDAEVSAVEAQYKSNKMVVPSKSKIISDLVKNPESETYKVLTDPENKSFGTSLGDWWNSLFQESE